MPYFQKYSQMQKSHVSSAAPSSHHSSHSSQTRQSYLKAFKKYYIDKIWREKMEGSKEKENLHYNLKNKSSEGKSQYALRPSTPTKSQALKKQLIAKKEGMSKSKLQSKGEKSILSKSKIANIMARQSNNLQQLLYSSISRFQEEVMQHPPSPSSLLSQNIHLKKSLQSLRTVLRTTLSTALQHNKQELTLMFEEYSQLIQKLLKDKQEMGQIINVLQDEIDNQKLQIQFYKAHEEEREIELERGQRERELGIQQVFRDFKEREKEREHDILQLKTAMQESLVAWEGAESSMLQRIQDLQHKNEELTRQIQKMRSECEQKSNEQTDTSLYPSDQVLVHSLKMKDQCIQRLQLVIQGMRRERYSSVDKMLEEMDRNIH